MRGKLTIHTMTFYKNSKIPTTEKIGKEIVSIPIHPNLEKTDVNKIVKYVNRFGE